MRNLLGGCGPKHSPSWWEVIIHPFEYERVIEILQSLCTLTETLQERHSKGVQMVPEMGTGRGQEPA